MNQRQGCGIVLPPNICIVALVKDMIPITRMIQTGDTLRYLYMGGRIGKAQHLVGSLLNIKPLIGMEDGVIVPLGQARSRLGAYRKIVSMMKRPLVTWARSRRPLCTLLPWRRRRSCRPWWRSG